jgi:hypothetical protein
MILPSYIIKFLILILGYIILAFGIFLQVKANVMVGHPLTGNPVIPCSAVMKSPNWSDSAVFFSGQAVNGHGIS